MNAAIDWAPVLNTTTDVIPAGGLMRVTGVDPDTGALTVTRPNSDGDVDVCVNGFALIPPKGTGEGSFGPRAVAGYDPSDGAPRAGEVWGPKGGGWLLRKGFPGFRILGGAGLGLVNVVTLPRDPLMVRIRYVTPPPDSTSFADSLEFRDHDEPNAIPQKWDPEARAWVDDPDRDPIEVDDPDDSLGWRPLTVNRKLPAAWNAAAGQYVAQDLAECAVVTVTSAQKDDAGMQLGVRVVWDSDNATWRTMEDCYVIDAGNS